MANKKGEEKLSKEAKKRLRLSAFNTPQKREYNKKHKRQIP